MYRPYTGIGSRITPIPVLTQMTALATSLSTHVLRSGAAPGADSAFEAGAANSEIYLPWPGFNNSTSNLTPTPQAHVLASQHHPYWDKCSLAVRKIMARNSHQVLGLNLDSPSEFLICWTPDGATTSTSRTTGGTGQAIRIANHHNIPVFNLHNADALTRLQNHLSTYLTYTI